MRTFQKSFVVILFLSFTVIQAQEVQLGLKLESNVIKTSTIKNYHISDIGPTALQINLAFYPKDYLAVEARLGAEGSTDYYQGVEYGLFARYYPTKNVYGVAGVMVHNNSNESHQLSGQYSNTLIMPGIGIGLNPGHFFVEAMYFSTGNKEVGWDEFYNPPYYKISRNINWVWKFGVGFSFKLFSI